MKRPIGDALAKYVHEAWAGWMRYLFSKSQECEGGAVIIPAGLVTRWKRQMETDYDGLPVHEQASDKEEAYKILGIVQRYK